MKRKAKLTRKQRVAQSRLQKPDTSVQDFTKWFLKQDKETKEFHDRCEQLTNKPLV